jgi:hypothetical protein
MEAQGIRAAVDTRAQRRTSGRGRKLAVVTVGSCLLVFGATGVASATTTAPDVSPIFCTAGGSCGSVSDTPPTTPSTPTKKDAEEARKAAHKAAEAAKKAAKEAEKAAKKADKHSLVNGGDLKQFLGDSSVIDNGGHKWG